MLAASQVDASLAIAGIVVSLLVGLLPFAYKVLLADPKANRAREKEHYRDVAKDYLSKLGATMSFLNAVRVDADNADELLSAATKSFAELEGLGQGDLVVAFGESPPVVWADRACRNLLREGLRIAVEARAERQTGDAASDTFHQIQNLTREHIDEGGPRELVRWALDAATERWPDRLVSFDHDRMKRLAPQVAERARLDLPPELTSGHSPVT